MILGIFISFVLVMLSCTVHDVMLHCPVICPKSSDLFSTCSVFKKHCLVNFALNSVTLTYTKATLRGKKSEISRIKS